LAIGLVSIGFEQVFEHGRGIMALVEVDRAPVDDQWPSGMIVSLVGITAKWMRYGLLSEFGGRPDLWRTRLGCPDSMSD
jgi:hypothetical protein